MSDSLPENINKLVDALSEEQRATLTDTFNYPVETLKRDITLHFERLESTRSSKKSEEIEAIFAAQFKNFVTELDSYVTGEKQPDSSYQAIAHYVTSDVSIASVLEKLSIEREQLASQYQQLKAENLDKADHKAESDKLAYGYLAQKRDIIRAEVEQALGNRPLYQFANPAMEQLIDDHSDRRWNETGTAHQITNGLIKGLEQEQLVEESSVIEPRETQIRGLKEIVHTLEDKLSDYGVDDGILKNINFSAIIQDRFRTIDENEITITDDKLSTLSGELFLKISNNEPLKDISDFVSQEIYEQANFKQSPQTQQHFDSRKGKNPQSPSPRIDLSDMGVSPAVAIAGLGIQTVGSWASRVSAADNHQLSTTTDPEKRKTLQKSRNRRLAFATVASVAGTALVFDGLIFKGKYTKQILNAAKDKLSMTSHER